MDSTENNLIRAQERFESAAGCDSSHAAVGFIGEGLASLTAALIAINQELSDTKRNLEQIKRSLAAMKRQ